MLYAEKIRMKYGRQYSQSLTEIDQIYIGNCGWYKKEDIYNHLVKNPRTIAVGIYPYPCLIPALSSNYEKYVRSNPNNYEHDNLLDLPKG